MGSGGQAGQSPRQAREAVAIASHPAQPDASATDEQKDDTDAGRNTPAKNRNYFGLNLALIIVAGVSALYWIGYHSEYLEVVGGLLGLGGAFAWIAFISNVIKEDRKTDIQDRFDAWMNRRLTTIWCTCIIGVLVIASLFAGSIHLDGRRSDVDRYVTIYEIEKDKTKADVQLHERLVKARERFSYPVWSLDRNKQFKVTVEGLPPAVTSVAGWSRTSLAIPSSFFRSNIILLRPDPEASATLANAEKKSRLIVKIGVDGIDHPIENFNGSSVWVGCDSSVEVPASLAERWSLELAAQGLPLAKRLPWMNPGAVAETVTLEAGEDIEFQLVHVGAASPWHTQVHKIASCESVSCFPQEIVLKLPSSSGTTHTGTSQ